MFSDDDEPPTYELGETHPLPMYSSHAGSSECLLQLEAPRMTGCPGCDWIYETKHMKINMGSRIWGLHAPSYGLGGRVEGLVKLSGEKDRIETVTATLEGRIRIVLGNRGTMSGESIVPLVSQKVTIYEHSMANLLPWDDEHHFSIEIPSESDVRGSTTLMPPSYFSYHQNVSCEVSYSIKFHLVRKGKGLKRTESKIIPILYLPKSQPTAPALPSIPRPSRHRDDASLFLHMFERVKTMKVHPFRPPECKARCLESFEDCVYLSLPSPLYFTSGQTIPFTLSLVFPDDPALAQLLTRNIRIQLLKRLTLSRKGVSEVVQRDTFVSQATLRYGSEYTEGISLLRGEIRGGESGRERSWKIEDLAEVQYVFRIMIRPPKNFTSHVPSFRHEEILQVATDSWGTLDRELSSTGGTPTPAIGLAANLRREF